MLVSVKTKEKFELRYIHQMAAINGAGMSFLIPQFWLKEGFYVSHSNYKVFFTKY
jgi:hypothetical protein